MRSELSLALVITMISLVGGLFGDTLHLQTGGTIEGTVLNPDQSPRKDYSVRLASGANVTIDADKVRRVEEPSEKQQRYRLLLSKMPAENAKNHWVMAESCKKLGLPTEREFHLNQVIQYDPDHELARKALKYKKQEDGSWAQTAVVMKERGLVKEGGRWEIPQHVALRTKQEAQKDEHFKWKRDIKLWRGWLGGRRHKQAVENITSIDSPAAASAISNWFWEERSVELQEELAEILGRLDSSTATQTLVKAAITASDPELRIFCVRQLKEHQRSAAIPAFIAELSNADNVIVNRAGNALSRYGDESAILPLIQALHTSHKFKVGSDSGGISAGFNRDPGAQSGLGGLSLGSNSKIISRSLENKGVRNALVAITNQGFDYNESAWKRWYLERTTPPQLDLRRDP